MNILNIFNILIIIISVYIIYNNNISIIKIFKNDIIKIIILFLMIIISNNQPTLSLLICIGYIITNQHNVKELFHNCLCGSKEEECPAGEKLIHIHGLRPFCGNPLKHLS